MPDKPSIAVLPFDNMSGDPKEDFFCDGITENIITSLSKIEDMFVIARNSTFAYKGKPVNVKQIARELGVRYVLEGSIQRSKDRLRINVQLIDAETGNHLWAERYDRMPKDIFAIQDEITMKILEGLRLKIASGDRARYWKGTENLEAYLKVLKALELYQHYNKDDMAIVRQLCHEAIALDPNWSKPYTILATSYWDACLWGWTKSCTESHKLAFDFAHEAISLDDSDTWAHLCLSMLYLRTKQCDKSISEAAKAVAITPNGANANMVYARTLSHCGKHKEAIDRM
ncbi:MAG: adenylate/guanylate cyclase domain-containing protein, partial [Deltaproteobacteria bacterium]|nr:adenylate/guanylate cyclase domain-containing protein [Deltaproteobacteria bacterium]